MNVFLEHTKAVTQPRPDSALHPEKHGTGITGPSKFSCTSYQITAQLMLRLQGCTLFHFDQTCSGYHPEPMWVQGSLHRLRMGPDLWGHLEAAAAQFRVLPGLAMWPARIPAGCRRSWCVPSCSMLMLIRQESCQTPRQHVSVHINGVETGLTCSLVCLQAGGVRLEWHPR